MAFSTTAVEIVVCCSPLPDCRPPSALIFGLCCVLRVLGAKGVVRRIKRSGLNEGDVHEITKQIESNGENEEAEKHRSDVSGAGRGARLIGSRNTNGTCTDAVAAGSAPPKHPFT